MKNYSVFERIMDVFRSNLCKDGALFGRDGPLPSDFAFYSLFWISPLTNAFQISNFEKHYQMEQIWFCCGRRRRGLNFFPCLSSLTFYHLPGHSVHIGQQCNCRGIQCVPISTGNQIECESKWIQLNQIHSSYKSVDSGRLNSINKHPARQVYDRGNLNDHIRTSNSEDGD